MPLEIGQEFGDPAAYPYMVVCSPSCHDTSTTRAWFEEDEGRRERFCSEMLGVHVSSHSHDPAASTHHSAYASCLTRADRTASECFCANLSCFCTLFCSCVSVSRCVCRLRGT